MKRVFALILALCMACALFACGKKQTEVAPGGDSPTVTPGATDPGSGPAENPGGSTGSAWAGTRAAGSFCSWLARQASLL